MRKIDTLKYGTIFGLAATLSFWAPSAVIAQTQENCRAQISEVMEELDDWDVSDEEKTHALSHITQAETALGQTSGTSTSGTSSGTTGTSTAGTTGTGSGSTTGTATGTTMGAAGGEAECLRQLEFAKDAAEID